MEIFSRLRDIINANINDMIDSAQEPEDLIKRIIREIEDALIELKAACAGIMADRKKIQRHKEQTELDVQTWADKAALAVNDDRDDLAREALLRKRSAQEQGKELQNKLNQQTVIIEQYHDQIATLQEKLENAREKQRWLVQQPNRSRPNGSGSSDMEGMAGTKRQIIIDELEKKMEFLETENTITPSTQRSNLESEFKTLTMTEKIEAELKALKLKLNKK